MYGLKRVFLLIGIGLMAWFGLACEKPMAVSPDEVAQSEISTAFTLPKATTSFALSRVVIIVTGAGMDSLKKTVDVTKAGLVRDTLQVRSGENRIFNVTAFQGATAVMAGRDSLDLAAGKQVELKMTLGFLVPALSLTSADTTVTKNGTFNVYVRAHHVDSLCTIGAKLLFDPAKLRVVDLGREDDFLKKNGGAVTQLQFSKDNVAGEVKLVLGVFPAAKSVSGEGKIARVVFQALEGPQADIELSVDSTEDSDLGLYDQRVNLMYAIALGSRIRIQ